MATVDYKSDKTRALEQAEGSDGRLNTSSRSDGRKYYNSRDVQRTFFTSFDHPDAAAGQFSLYIQNTSTSRELIISVADLSSVEAAKVKFWFVSGTPTGGGSITDINSNKNSSKDSESVSFQGLSGDPVTSIQENGMFAVSSILAGGSKGFDFGDTVRLGQNDAIAIEYDGGVTGDFFGTVTGFYEKSRGED